MKKYFFCVITCLFWINFVYAGDIEGIVWSRMDVEQKQIYLQGIYDGLNVFEVHILKLKSSENSQIKDYYPWKINFADIQKALDKFYNDYQNNLIPVTEALHIIKLEMSGETQETINDYKQTIKQIYKEKS